MSKTFKGRYLPFLIVLSFICGIIARTCVLNATKPDFVFCRTLEPQFALVVEVTDN